MCRCAAGARALSTVRDAARQPTTMSKTPKSEKKDKKEKTPKKDKEKTPKKASTPGGEGSDSGGGELRAVCAIATPLADLNTTKKILKVVKKGMCVYVCACTRGTCSRVVARAR